MNTIDEKKPLPINMFKWDKNFPAKSQWWQDQPSIRFSRRMHHPTTYTTYRSRVKIYITLVFDLIEVSTLLRSVQSINDSSIPILVVHWRNSRLVPPYKSFILTRWSPAFSRNVIAVVVASPEENTIPVFKRNQCTFKGSNSVKICYISLLKRDLF